MSLIKDEDLQALNDKVYERGHIDREHLLEFLTLIPSTDDQQIISEVRNWITGLHDDPKYSHIKFPAGDIDAIISDLDSYGRVQAKTILNLKSLSVKTVPKS